jgi:methylated-DNA-protein-cysteine methyltransferase-like protein
MIIEDTAYWKKEYMGVIESRKQVLVMIESQESPFTRVVKEIIIMIPAGRVSTYGQIAAYAGNPRGARLVSWILHSCSRKDNLPWHRVVNSKGRISLRGAGYEMQKALLEQEGVQFSETDTIDFTTYLWQPEYPIGESEE